MLNARKKTLIAALLLMFLSSQVARAEVKLYQYDGKLPFVQMMLNMMVAMGILDRLPSSGRYGGYPSSSWGGLSNPYARALAMRGLSPGSVFAGQYGNNPFMRSPWLQSPWSSPAVSGADWGSPDWGVLPVESYARSPYGSGAYDSLPGDAYWSRDELDGWVNEPWETSAWNPKAEKSTEDKSSQHRRQCRWCRTLITTCLRRQTKQRITGVLITRVRATEVISSHRWRNWCLLRGHPPDVTSSRNIASHR